MRVVVDLQRADAGCLIDDFFQTFKADGAADRLHQCMHAEAELEVEDDRTVFDQGDRRHQRDDRRHSAGLRDHGTRRCSRRHRVVTEKLSAMNFL